MKKKVVRSILLVAFIALALFAICNVYLWIVSGKQDIKISTSTKAYSNSDLYVSVIAQKDGLDLETRKQNKTFRC